MSRITGFLWGEGRLLFKKNMRLQKYPTMEVKFLEHLTPSALIFLPFSPRPEAMLQFVPAIHFSLS